MILKSKTLMLASAFFLAGTFGTSAQETPQLPDLNLTTPQQEKIDPNHILAVVNGKNVTAGDLDKIAVSINPDLMQMPIDQRHIVLLRYYIDSLALVDATDKAGLDKTEEYAAMMNEARANVLQRLYYEKEIVDKISDADLKKRYDEVVSSLPREEEVHARHILLPTKEDALKVIAELKKGSKFEDIAKKSSTDDGSAALGGDLGYFTKNQMVKPFADAAFTLKVGSYTQEPVETPFGWHVILVEDHRDKQAPAFEDMKNDLRNYMARERYQKAVLEMRGKMDIKYPDEAIAKAMAAHVNENNDTDIPTDDLSDDPE